MATRKSICSSCLAIGLGIWILVYGAAAEEGVTGLVIRAAPEPATIQFGDPLKIRVTVENPSQQPVSLSPGDLYLIPRDWKTEGHGGGDGDNVLLTAAGADGKASTIVEPQGRIVLTGTLREWTVCVLGPIEGTLRVGSDSPQLQKLLPSQPLTINFEVTPSQLMRDAWAAKTPAQRARLRDAMRELLKLRASAQESRDRDFVEHTLEYMAGHALPLLEAALDDEDPVVRSQAIQAYRYGAWAVGNMHAMLDNREQPPRWAKDIVPGDQQAAEATLVRLATRALEDDDALVRCSAVNVFNWKGIASALREVEKLHHDPDPSVRSTVLDYLSKYSAEAHVAETIVASLEDPHDEVRQRALAALETGPHPPPLDSLKRAFKSSKGETAARLLALLWEQEDATLGDTLLTGFSDRSRQVRLACVTAVAGHTDEASVELVRLALGDQDAAVQRTGLMRTLALPRDVALPLLERYLEKGVPAELRPVAEAAREEIVRRRLFPFLERAAAAPETTFPSRNGTVPMVSPDGKWVAYVETGWERPGGTGGTGRSNLLSLVHVVGADGSADRVVSDMFLVCWMADSRRVASARDGFAAICDLEGKAVVEFGEPSSYFSRQDPAGWARADDLRSQLGTQMPHRKRLPEIVQYGIRLWLEHAGFSPDGKWFGPIQDGQQTFMLGSDGQRTKVDVPEGVRSMNQQATWSPDGRHVLLSGGLMIDTRSHTTKVLQNMQSSRVFGSWNGRKCRWNPWAKDGSKLAFFRDGEVWISAPDGSGARQLTFDGSQKAFPTFSPDAARIAYVTWQPSKRQYTRVGPTDLWVVDVETTLAVRATAQSAGRIHCLDWLDTDRLIFDRLAAKSLLGYRSTLQQLDLTATWQQAGPQGICSAISPPQ